MFTSILNPAATNTVLRAGTALLLTLLFNPSAYAGKRVVPSKIAQLQSPIVIPPPIVNANVDTMSDQVIYGAKVFTQPIVAELSGTATAAESFTGTLQGDVRGTQSATQIVNVPLTALPAIGFGYLASTPKIKYINADAHPADTRRDGSIAHPYDSLGIAAANANDGDHFILIGNLSGTAVFTRSVTVQGSSSSQTTLYGAIEFSGYQASHLRDLRINCNSGTACVVNRTSGGSELVLDRVAVSQSGAGAALHAMFGGVVASRSDFTNKGGGAAVLVDSLPQTASRLRDCAISGGDESIALLVMGGKVVIDGGSVSAEGNVAVYVKEGDVSVHNARIMSGNLPIMVIDTKRVLVRGSYLKAGAGHPAIRLSIQPILTFAFDPEYAYDPTAPTFLQNQYVTDSGIAAMACDYTTDLVSHGNINLNNLQGLLPPLPVDCKFVGVATF